jgi:hypothetical protein
MLDSTEVNPRSSSWMEELTWKPQRGYTHSGVANRSCFERARAWQNKSLKLLIYNWQPLDWDRERGLHVKFLIANT